MAKKKKYLLKPINFGKNGEPSRKLVEKYLKKNGNQSLSKLMRRLVVYYLSPKKEFKNYKIEMLKEQEKKLKKEIGSRSEQIDKIRNELKKLK